MAQYSTEKEKGKSMQTIKHTNSLVILFLLGFSLMVPSSVAFGGNLDGTWVSEPVNGFTIKLRIANSRNYSRDMARGDYYLSASPLRTDSGEEFPRKKGRCETCLDSYNNWVTNDGHPEGWSIYWNIGVDDQDFPNIGKGDIYISGHSNDFEIEAKNIIWEKQ